MLISKKIGALIASLFCASAALADAPARVVSVNLCTDQLAMTLSSPKQIISITYLSRDPMNSAMSGDAQAYNINHGQIEELVLLKPDLVLVNEWTSPFLLSMFDEFEIPYEKFVAANTLEEVAPLIRKMGKALGQNEKAEEVAAAFEIRKEALLAQAQQINLTPRIAAYGPNGWMSGSSTLSADILAKAGFENIASEYGLESGGFMPLEALVAAKPDVILTSNPWPATSRAESLLAHPALLAVTDGVVEQPSTDATWGCGTPKVLNALSDMIDLAQTVSKEKN